MKKQWTKCKTHLFDKDITERYDKGMDEYEKIHGYRTDANLAISCIMEQDKRRNLI